MKHTKTFYVKNNNYAILRYGIIYKMYVKEYLKPINGKNCWYN